MPPQDTNIDSGASTTATPTTDQRIAIEGLDLAKFDKLLDTVTNRLGGGGFGDWWIEGNRASNDNRHHALQEVFTLRQAVEQLNAILQQQGRAPELLDKEIKNNAKASTAMNAKMKEVMRTIVSQEMEPKLRDFAVKNERLEERLAKCEKDRDNLQEKLATLEKKKKSDTTAPTLTQHRALETTVKSLEKSVAESEKESSGTVHGELTKLARDLEQNQKDTAGVIADLAEVDCTVREVDGNMDYVKSTVKEIRKKADRKTGSLARDVEENRKKVKLLTSELAMTDNWVGSTNTRVSTLKSTVKEMQKEAVFQARVVYAMEDNVVASARFMEDNIGEIRGKVKLARDVPPRWRSSKDTKYVDAYPDIQDSDSEENA